jgi:hypothetical protein
MMAGRSPIFKSGTGIKLQCDKNDYWAFWLGSKGITGKKAVDSAALTVRIRLQGQAPDVTGEWKLCQD